MPGEPLRIRRLPARRHAGGNVNHSRITGSLHSALDRRLRGAPCEPLGPDAGIETVNKTVRYPDVLVTCTRANGTDRKVPGVVIVFEELSPSTGAIDRIVKVREYAAIPSIRRYVILEATAAGLLVLERNHPDEPWRASTLAAGDILLLPEINIEIPVDEIYERVDFTEQNGHAS